MVDLNEYKDLLIDKYPSSFNAKTVDNILESPWVLYNEIIGGIPVGTIISIQSEAGAGKTTLMQQLCAHLQKEGHRVVYIDTEYSMSIRRMNDLGLDINNVMYIQPPSLDEQYSLIRKMLNLKIDHHDEQPLVFAFDSITQSSTLQEISDADNFENKSPALKQRLNSRFLPMLLKLLSQTNSTLIMINQPRTNIKMNPFSFGQPDEFIVGGKALSFYPTQDIRLKIGGMKDVERFDFEGRIIKFKQNKNRIMSPLIEFPMVLNFEKGFVNDASIFVYLTDITKGEWKKANMNDPIPFEGGHGQYWKINAPFYHYEKNVRWNEFLNFYDTDEEFQRVVNGIVKTFIGRMYKHMGEDYIYPIEKVEIVKDTNEEDNDKKGVKNKSETK